MVDNGWEQWKERKPKYFRLQGFPKGKWVKNTSLKWTRETNGGAKII